MATKKLQGKVAIITGAASGIGAATARLFASEGAKVIVADIQDELGSSISQEIGALYVHCDVSKEDDVAAAVHSAVSSFGSLDIMFNNAAVADAKNSQGCMPCITEIEAEDLDHVCNVNIKGTLYGVKHAAKSMVATKTAGCILNTASIAAVMAQRTYHCYTISKHAVIGITKTSASELSRHGIRVNCVSPSGILTPLCREALGVSSEADATAMKELYKINSELSGVRLEVEDIARAALFLCCEDSKYITGHNLVVDGGWCNSRPLNPFKNPYE